VWGARGRRLARALRPTPQLDTNGDGE